VQGFVDPLDGPENVLKIAFDVGSVGVKLCVETGVLENSVRTLHFLPDRYSGPDRNDLYLGYGSHGGAAIVATKAPAIRSPLQ